MTDQNTLNKVVPDHLGLDLLNKVIFRTLTKHDLSTLEWEGEYTRFRRVYKEIYKRSQTGLAVMWGADLPDVGLIGQAFVQLDSRKKDLADKSQRAYVHSFRVRLAYRRVGLGTKIMQVVEEDLTRRGYQELCLNVARKNEGALRLYKRLGYRVLKADPGHWKYYDQHNILREVIEPGWRMIKEL